MNTSPYFLRERDFTIDYNDDNYFDMLGVSGDVSYTKSQLIKKISQRMHIINKCNDNDNKSYQIMMCFRLGNEFVRRFPQYENFKNVLMNKMNDFLMEPVFNEKHKKMIRHYLCK